MSIQLIESFFDEGCARCGKTTKDNIPWTVHYYHGEPIEFALCRKCAGVFRRANPRKAADIEYTITEWIEILRRERAEVNPC